jgi:putative DNA primase/helicase
MTSSSDPADDAVVRLPVPKAAPLSDGQHRDRENKRQPVKRDQLLALIEPANLWMSTEGEAFVSFEVENPQPHMEHWEVQSKVVEKWLFRRYYLDNGEAPSPIELSSAIGMMEARAHFSGLTYPVYLRVAEHEGSILVDLADDLWRAVQITSDGWKVISKPPVKFRRSKAMKPLPVPKRGGKIDDLRPFLNVASDDDFRLTVAWLLGALRAKGPYPVLVLTGEQGSSKTTFARVLRRLFDPSLPDTRALPRNDRDLMVTAVNNWGLCFDNLSGMTPWMSDALCRLATGAGFGVRQNYTDKEETLFDAARPIILNGITDFVYQQDLIDRIIILHLPSITDGARQAEADFWGEFERAWPPILGALFNVMAEALARLSTVQCERLPRMADFAKWIMAAEAALGWSDGAFLDAYEENRAMAASDAMEGHPVASGVINLVRKEKKWTGTASQLLEVLLLHVPSGQLQRGGPQMPKGPGQLSGALKRLKPALRREGVSIEVRRKHGGKRLIDIGWNGDDGDVG